MLPEGSGYRHSEKPPTIGVIGAAGLTGELFGELYGHDYLGVEPVAVIKPGQTYNQFVFGKATSSVEDVLDMHLDHIFVATGNADVAPVLERMRSHLARKDFENETMPQTIVVTANGLLEDVVSDYSRTLPLVRGLLYTPVTREGDGHLGYDASKLRMVLAPGLRDDRVLKGRSFRSLVRFLRKAHIDVYPADDHRAAERTKLAANTMAHGAAAIMGVPNHAVYTDRDLGYHEARAFGERRAVLAEGIKQFDPPPWFKLDGKKYTTIFSLASRKRTGGLARKVVAKQMRKNRGDKPPAAWKRMEKNKPTELPLYLGIFARAGILIDEAALAVYERHQAGSINLGLMNLEQRRSILLRELHKVREAAGYNI